jgi:hypothetical protein
VKRQEKTPDLRQLYQRTRDMENDRAATRALDWVEQVLPVFLSACRRTLHTGSLETIETWLAWLAGDRSHLLSEAGKGAILSWRRRWMQTLLTTVHALKQTGSWKTREGREEFAALIGPEVSPFEAGFPHAFRQDLVNYLCADPVAEPATDAAQTAKPPRIPFPLVLAESFVDGGYTTNVLLAEFVLEPVSQANGSIFLHPEQAVLRCMEASFAAVFAQAQQAVQQTFAAREPTLPGARVSIRAVKPEHERLLNNSVLNGTSGAGALALGLACLAAGAHCLENTLAVSFALSAGKAASVDGNCHAVSGIGDKILGCARQGMKQILVAKAQEKEIAPYAYKNNLGILSAETFSAAAAILLERAASSPSASGPPALPKQKKVVVLYKRRNPDSEAVSRLLEERLPALGQEVFIDRHLPIGIAWAQEIERRIRTADAVVPLLTPEAVGSEMFQQEIETAYQAGQSTGQPVLLPVRLRFPETLTDPLGSILNPLQCAHWEGAADDARLVEQIVHALQNPPRPALARPKLEPDGGAVPLDSPFYIVRSADREFHEAIAWQEGVILVRGPRQIGKTSLLARGLDQTRQAGARCVWMDLQKLSAAQLASPEQLYRTFAEEIADQLELDTAPARVWTATNSPNINFERFMKREVLGKIEAPVVWGLDEVDRLFDREFKNEVFGLFRGWYNQRAFDPAGHWKRLTLILAYSTEAHLFITDRSQSPFNVGTRLTLLDFTPEQIAELNRRYETPLQTADELDRFTALVGGNPYLVRRGLSEMKKRGLRLEALDAVADRDQGPFGDHLHRLLFSLALDPEIREVVRGVLRGAACPTAESFSRLWSAGIVAGDTAEEARPRCELYARYLRKHLL